MKIISLSSNIAGPACAVSQCIKKYFYNNDYKTNFFDFLEVDLISIITLFKIDISNIEGVLKTNNHIVINKDDKNSVYFNHFNKMISHHDLNKNYNGEEYQTFIEKYKRRYYRLMDYIYNEDKIFFIRYGYEEYNNILYFIDTIHKINPNLQIFFINVNFDENNLEIDYNIKNYHYINFYKYLDKDIQYESELYYKTFQFNWNHLFTFINNLDNLYK
jgi:hypothetical protein